MQHVELSIRGWLLAVLGCLSVVGLRAQPAPTAPDFSDIPEDKRSLFHAKGPQFGTVVDPRITSRLQVAPGTPIRSYAVVISISKYPRFADPKDQVLPAAARDLENLKGFLKRQGFDEIIVLENGNATKQNIDYILTVYLQKQLDVWGGGARVLFAYSGHGAPGALVLGQARDEMDYENLYPLTGLNTQLQDLARKSFQMLALINACNSGGLFLESGSSAGNNMFPGEIGAHAITASKPNELAYALTETSGSIFFDTIIKGVEDGKADIDYAGWISEPDGRYKLLGGGIVRSGALAGYLSGAVERAGKNPVTGLPYSQPIWGSIRKGSNGAFFFLGPAVKDIQTLVSVRPPNAIRVGGSAVVGLPGYKVFNPPDTYGILGVDVNALNGKIDWAKVASTPRLRFAYIKVSYRAKDEKFDENWAGARAAGLKCGAYHIFNASESADEQFKLIKQSIPAAGDALPFAIDAELYQLTDHETAMREIARLKSLCADYFQKPVIVWGNAAFFADFPEVIGSDDGIWLARWVQIGGISSSINPPALKSKEPWTLWQFGSSLQIAGIPGESGFNAFFGTEENFEAFARGEKGVATKAAGNIQ